MINSLGPIPCLFHAIRKISMVGCRITCGLRPHVIRHPTIDIFPYYVNKQGITNSVKASLIVYVYASTHAWHVMPKVSTQVYMLDRKIWKLCRPRGNRRKRTKCDQFVCPTSDFFDFCNPCFLALPMLWILSTKAMQKSVTTVNLHCSFAKLKNKHTCIGVLGTNVATISGLHWSPVSGYRI